MNALVVAALGLGAMLSGYRFYSKFIARRVYGLEDRFRTPAHEFEDGVDFVPTNRFVLWGHNFTSVSGAAPIVGPAIAVIWGWLPAFLWVVFGTIFFAGVHDFGALWASVRNKGKSIGALTEDIIGSRARNLFMIVIFLLLLMVNAVFGVVIAKLLVKFPASVLPVWGVIGVAVIIGWLIYRRGFGLLWMTLIGVASLYLLIWGGQYVPLDLPAHVAGLGPRAQWIVVLFAYAGIASLLPVWTLLQPRDYINGIQLIVGLALFFLAVIIFHPSVVAPLVNHDLPADAPPIIPLLFVTIACGAVSGFHSLVASGTTSKQLDKDTDARFVGYLGIVGEGTLALTAILCATAGYATLADWQGVYTHFGAGSVAAFVHGGANILHGGLGFSTGFGATLFTVMAVLFAGTTMDTGVRLQRYVIQEWGNMHEIPWLTNNTAATLIAVGSCLALAFGAGGAEGSGGLLLWPLFGTTNQLLAGLALLVVSVLVARQKRPVWYTVTPMVLLLLMTIGALLIQLVGFYQNNNWFLVAMDLIILIAAIWVTLEAGGALARALRGAPQARART